MQQFESKDILTNIYVSDMNVNDFKAKLDIFKITGISNRPSNEQIKDLIFAMEKKFDGVYSFLWNKNIIAGTGNIQIPSTGDIQIGNFKLKLTNDNDLKGVLNSNVSDLITKYYKFKLKKDLIVDNDHFYEKDGIYKGGKLILNGFQIKNKILSSNEIIIAIDHKIRILTKIENENSIMELKKNKKYAKLYDSLSKRFISVTEITDIKVGDFKIQGENISLITYLAHKYNLNPEEIKTDLNVVKSHDYAYTPQFLFAVSNNRDISIKTQKSVDVRYMRINEAIKNFNLNVIKFKDFAINFVPFKINQNHFVLKSPVRKFSQNGKNINESLKYGFLYPNYLEHILIYSNLQKEQTDEIYNRIKVYSKERYKFELPERYIPITDINGKLGHDITKIIQTLNNFGIIAISDNDNIYSEISDYLEEDKFAFKMMRIDTANKIIKKNLNGIIGNFLMSFLLRANNIPWLLTDINYDNYLFVDVGRGNANYIGYSYATDNYGKFKVKTSKPIKGEDLSYNDLRSIFTKLSIDNEGLIYVRDGNISQNEHKAIISNIEESNFKSFALIEYKKIEPYRIFRTYNRKIYKPKSGECIKLDENNFVIVNTGSKEYDRNEGTPSTKLITFTMIKGDLDKTKIIKDLHSMCYLNWSTPSYIFSDPAPLHYIDNTLEDYGKNIIRKFVPF